MIPLALFDERGRFRVPLGEDLYAEDGSHPEEWRGHFVVVMNDNAASGGKTVPYHVAVLRHGMRHPDRKIEFQYRATFHPTLFRDHASAMAELSELAADVRKRWSSIAQTPDDDIFLKRDVWYRGTLSQIDPLFEILDACDYRIQTSVMARGHKTRVVRDGRGRKADAPPVCDFKRWLAEKEEKEERERKKKKQDAAKPTKPVAKTKQFNDGFVQVASTVFFARDSKSGLFLRIDGKSGIRGATLAEADDATYFDGFDSLVEIMSAIEKSFWNAEFQKWHLVVTPAVMKDGKVVDMRIM